MEFGRHSLDTNDCESCRFCPCSPELKPSPLSTCDLISTDFRLNPTTFSGYSRTDGKCSFFICDFLALQRAEDVEQQATGARRRLANDLYRVRAWC